MTAPEVSQLYTRWHRRLLSFAMKMMGTREDAEDAIQESFLNLQRRDTTMPVPSQEPSLLFTTVRNTCIDKLRLYKKMPTYEMPGYIGSYDDPVLEKLDRAMCESFLKKAIEKLNREEKRVIKMVLSGMERGEICAATGKRPSTVDTQRQHAISILKKAIQNYNSTLCQY